MAELVGFDARRLYQVSQVHGKIVVLAEGDPADVSRIEADALFAHGGSGAVVGVRVADCVPILMGDPDSGAVAAIHAGWKGIVAEVVQSAFLQVAIASPRAVVDLSRFVAAIGACIGACCFEVGVDVAQQIMAAAKDAPVIARQVDAKAFVDLRAAVRAQLLALGLDDANIEDVPGCTKCDAARFHSYRRDAAESGRSLAVIRAK